MSKKFDTKNTSIIVLFLIISAVLYYLFDVSKTVEFDNDFMYIKGKSGEEKIPLKNVYKIKLTMIEINKNNMWKIGYYDNNRIKKSVRILPRFLNKHFDEFTIQVKIANKNVNIQNWSHSLDLDQ
jgi:ribosomal protein L31E